MPMRESTFVAEVVSATDEEPGRLQTQTQAWLDATRGLQGDADFSLEPATCEREHHAAAKAGVLFDSHQLALK